jgi:hypothetical protein
MSMGTNLLTCAHRTSLAESSAKEEGSNGPSDGLDAELEALVRREDPGESTGTALAGHSSSDGRVLVESLPDETVGCGPEDL